MMWKTMRSQQPTHVDVDWLWRADMELSKRLSSMLGVFIVSFLFLCCLRDQSTSVDVRPKFTYKWHYQKTIPETGKTLPGAEKGVPGAELTERRRIVFIKTHKTASTTMAGMFEKYGYYRNYTFVIGRSHVFSNRYKFFRGQILKFPGMEGRHYDMLVNHARYNRREMDLLLPNATYITIIRHPETQLESAFTYFKMHRSMGIAHAKNPFRTFMKSPQKYYTPKKNPRWFQTRNGVLFDLGFDHRYDTDDAKIRAKVAEIDREFSLVLLQEYFDESLILLRDLLRWDLADILYLVHNRRKPGSKLAVSDDTRKRIREWSRGDVLLYERMNRTFWEKVANYGPSFQEDLRAFRGVNRALSKHCEVETKQGGVFTFPGGEVDCTAVKRADLGYTSLIRKSMRVRYGKR